MARDWVKAHEITFTLGGSNPNSNDVSVNEEFGDNDCTVITSPTDTDTGLLSYEGDNDVVKRSVQFTALIDRNSLASFTPGSEIDTTIAVNGFITWSGKVRLTSANHKGGAKGMYQVSGQGYFTGAVTVTRAA